jgi:hypothetical protein
MGFFFVRMVLWCGCRLSFPFPVCAIFFVCVLVFRFVFVLFVSLHSCWRDQGVFFVPASSACCCCFFVCVLSCCASPLVGGARLPCYISCLLFVAPFLFCGLFRFSATDVCVCEFFFVRWFLPLLLCFYAITLVLVLLLFFFALFSRFNSRAVRALFRCSSPFPSSRASPSSSVSLFFLFPSDSFLPF